MSVETDEQIKDRWAKGKDIKTVQSLLYICLSTSYIKKL